MVRIVDKDRREPTGDIPPRESVKEKRTRTKTAKPVTPPRKITDNDLREKLEDNFVKLAMLISLRDQYDGIVILTNAPKLAEQFVETAKENPRVRKMLVNFVSIGTYSGLTGALVSIAVPILWHHGVIPEQFGIFIEAPEIPEKYRGRFTPPVYTPPSETDNGSGTSENVA